MPEPAEPFETTPSRPLGAPESEAAERREQAIVTRHAAETRALGERLGEVAEAGDLICLYGDLGAGKTQLAKGIGLGLGVEETVNSPSFVLMSEYEARLRLFHIDLFRLEGTADAVGGGLVDERQADGLTVIEWAERLADALPAERLDVTIDGTGDAPRTIRLATTGGRYGRYLDAAAVFARGRDDGATARPTSAAASTAAAASATAAGAASATAVGATSEGPR